MEVYLTLMPAAQIRNCQLLFFALEFERKSTSRQNRALTGPSAEALEKRIFPTVFERVIEPWIAPCLGGRVAGWPNVLNSLRSAPGKGVPRKGDERLAGVLSLGPAGLNAASQRQANG